MTSRIPAEIFQVGDEVRAVEGGPRGKVIDADRGGWTLVQYPTTHRRRRQQGSDGVMPYKHGEDRLILVDPQREAAQDDPRGEADR